MKQRYKQLPPDYRALKADSEGYTVMLYKLVSYVNYEVDDREIVKSAKKWIKANTDYDTAMLHALPDSFFTSVGKFCYILDRGGELSDKLSLTLHSAVDQIYNKAKEYHVEPSEVLEQPKKVTNIQDYMRDKAREDSGEIEFWVDEFVKDPKHNSLGNRDIRGLFSANKLKPGHLRFIVSFYEQMIPELDEVVSGEDDSLQEAYSHLSKTNVKQLREFYSRVVDVANLLKTAGVAKTRTKRPVDKNKKVSNLKYLTKDERSGIQSVNPIHVLGARSLWCFNTKTRKLGVYYAADESGLDVKGTSIKNFSSKSTEKTVRTSAKIDLNKIVSSKISVKKEIFDSIKSVETAGNGRFNEYVIILSVDK